MGGRPVIVYCAPVCFDPTGYATLFWVLPKYNKVYTIGALYTPRHCISNGEGVMILGYASHTCLSASISSSNNLRVEP